MVAKFLDLDREGHLHFQTMEEKCGLLFCFWLQPCTGKTVYRSFLCHICRSSICWDPEILVPWQHTTPTSCQNAACSNELFSLTGRSCFGGKRFDYANVNFCLLFHTHIDFLPLFKCKALHCGWLRALGCLIFPKCLIWIILSHFLPARECHFFLQYFVTLGPAR